MPADAVSACAAFTGTIANDNTITTVQAAVPKRRKHATVLAPVQGEAASRRPRGRPGPPRARRLRIWSGRRNGAASGRTEEWQIEKGDTHASLLPSPHRERAADDGRCRDRPEVPAVQRVLGLPVHEKEFVLADNTTAVPDRQRPAAAVSLARFTHVDLIDRDVRPLLQTVCPGSASTRFNMGMPTGR
jgi:hypothetical protein